VTFPHVGRWALCNGFLRPEDTSRLNKIPVSLANCSVFGQRPLVIVAPPQPRKPPPFRENGKVLINSHKQEFEPRRNNANNEKQALFRCGSFLISRPFRLFFDFVMLLSLPFLFRAKGLLVGYNGSQQPEPFQSRLENKPCTTAGALQL